MKTSAEIVSVTLISAHAEKGMCAICIHDQI